MKLPKAIENLVEDVVVNSTIVRNNIEKSFEDMLLNSPTFKRVVNMVAKITSLHNDDMENISKILSIHQAAIQDLYAKSGSQASSKTKVIDSFVIVPEKDKEPSKPN